MDPPPLNTPQYMLDACALRLALLLFFSRKLETWGVESAPSCRHKGLWRKLSETDLRNELTGLNEVGSGEFRR